MGKLIIKMNKTPYLQDKDIKNLIAYIDGNGKNEDTQNVIYTNANGVKRGCNEAAGQFIKMQRALGKTNGRRAYHMVVSFEDNISNPDIVIQASEAIGKEIFRKYQVFFGIHASTDNLHTHFAINAVSYIDGKKWHTNKHEFQALKENLLNTVNEVMSKNNLPSLTLTSE